MSTNENPITPEQAMHTRLCAYVLGELDDDERVEVERALQRDPELVAERDRIAATVGLVQEALDPADGSGPSDSLSREASERLLTEARRRARPRIPAGHVLRLAAAVLVVVGGLQIWRTTRPADRAPEGRFGETAQVDHIEEELAKLGYGGDDAQAKPSSEPAPALALGEKAEGDPAWTEEEIRSRLETVLAEGKGNADVVSRKKDSAQEASRLGLTANEQEVARMRGEQERLTALNGRYREIDERIRELGEKEAQRDPSATAGLDRAGVPTEEAVLPSGGALRAGETELLREIGYANENRPLDAQEVEDLNDLGYAGEVGDENGYERGAEVLLAGGPVDVEIAQGAASAPGAELDPAGPATPGVPNEIIGTGGGAGGAYGGKSVRRAETTAPPPARAYDQPAPDTAFEGGGATLGESAIRLDREPHARADGKAGSAGADAFHPGDRGQAWEPVTVDAEMKEQLQELGYLGDDDGRDADDAAALDTYYRFRYGGRGNRGWTPDDVDRWIDRFLRDCRRRPRERPRDMFFRFWGDNAFVRTHQDPLATIAADVDTASYALARNYLRRGTLPPKEQVRTEEFLNYFAPDVAPPVEDDFRIETELAPSRFGPAEDHWMLRVAVRGREVASDERQPLALVLVIDVSGSMKQENRLELVKHGVRLLLSQLDARDAIGIVAFSTEARLVLPMTSAADRALIESALHGLNPKGSTNAEAGLKLGYELLLRDFTDDAHNRVVLFSDGVANTGQTDQDRITFDVARKRSRGIYLNTIGVGMGNHNDLFLEQLANKGDGMCNYVDTPLEARRALVDRFAGAFEPIARDVKLQVEFDPGQVLHWRQLGYENRRVADADFRNDAVDAGEVGAGHQVVALFEIVRPGGAADPETPLATVRLRWKPPHGARGADPELEVATERAQDVLADSAAGAFAATSAGFRRSVLVAQFAECLRRSVHSRDDSLEVLLDEARRLRAELGEPDFDELVELMLQARGLILADAQRYDELARTIDEVRRNAWLHAELEELESDSAELELLREQNRLLEQRIRELLRRKLEESQRLRRR